MISKIIFLLITPNLFFSESNIFEIKGTTYQLDKKSQTENRVPKRKNTISWNPYYKLKVSDFKSKEKSSYKGTAAITASSFGFSITNNNGDISGSIFVRFYPKDSWWNPNQKNDHRTKEILKHEQLHFDITELFGRKLYKEVIRLRDRDNLNSSTIENAYKRIEKEYHKYQDDYDKDTEHSLNEKEQTSWEKRIRKELNEYKDYSSYHNF